MDLEEKPSEIQDVEADKELNPTLVGGYITGSE